MSGRISRTSRYSQFHADPQQKIEEPGGFRVSASWPERSAPGRITDKIRNANSLSFVGGVPIYERYYLGSENDIRGYDSRVDRPDRPVRHLYNEPQRRRRDQCLGHGRLRNTGLDPRTRDELIRDRPADRRLTVRIRHFSREISGSSAATPSCLGNFEYRMPIFGPATMAFFADVGSRLQSAKVRDTAINSEFLPDDIVHRRRNPDAAWPEQQSCDQCRRAVAAVLQQSTSRPGHQDIARLQQSAGLPVPRACRREIQAVYLRGDIQQNRLLKVDHAAFNKLGDFKSSVGIELRVQVPVVNVPFRLIYYYNPNAKLGFTQEVPGVFLPGKRTASALPSAEPSSVTPASGWLSRSGMRLALSGVLGFGNVVRRHEDCRRDASGTAGRDAGVTLTSRPPMK